MKKNLRYVVGPDGRLVAVKRPAPNFAALEAAVKKAAATVAEAVAADDLTHPNGRPIGHYL